jgi:hypothetical protein
MFIAVSSQFGTENLLLASPCIEMEQAICLLRRISSLRAKRESVEILLSPMVAKRAESLTVVSLHPMYNATQYYSLS